MSTNTHASKGKWGPGVLGQDAYDAEQAFLKSGAHKWGPGVIDPVAPKKPVNVLATPKPEPVAETPKKGKKA